MGLSRVAAALTDGFDAILRKAEDPTRNVEATLQQMRMLLEDARRELVRAMAKERQLQTRQAELDQEVGSWYHRAELAVKAGDDDLARRALKRRKRAELDHQSAQQRSHAQSALVSDLKTAWKRMKLQLADFSARGNTIAAQSQLARTGTLGGDASAFDAFDQIEARVQDVEDVFEAQREVEAELGGAPKDLALEQRFLALEQTQPALEEPQVVDGALDVEQELEQLRGKVRIGVRD